MYLPLRKRIIIKKLTLITPSVSSTTTQLLPKTSSRKIIKSLLLEMTILLIISADKPEQAKAIFMIPMLPNSSKLVPHAANSNRIDQTMSRTPQIDSRRINSINPEMILKINFWKRLIN